VGAFRAAVARGLAYAESGKLVTFGIQPTRAETGYGYISIGTPLAGEGGGREIRGFVEKPDTATAERYVASGEYLWNSGIFMMRASVWIAQLGAMRPDMLNACRAAFAARSQDRDFGSKDGDGNVLRGDVMAVNTRDTLAISQSRMVACVGLTDTVVVETPDAVLVAHKSDLQQIKQVVERLKREKRPEADAHRKIYRPWGYYDSIDTGTRFQVKRIMVNPGAAISLQMHHHRAEHWIVVKGTARVIRGEETILLSENESAYIPIGTRHRLENPGKLQLEIIEVQSGAYLGEDDIVRFEDTYGRT